MSKPRLGAPKQVAVGLLAGALAVFGIALAPSAGAVPDVTTDRVAGTTRFGTASAACAKAYPSGTSTAIIATARNFPDALAASGLAGANKACIFLTEVDDVPDVTLQGLTQNKITKSIIVGGTSAVSTAAENELKAAGQTVSRIAGADRYATAAAIANAITTVGSVGGAATCIVASGEVAADALSAGPVAARGDGTNPFPILLVRQNEIPAATAAALTAKCKNAVIVGGTAAISDAVKTQVGTATGDTSVDRVAGTDRFLTSVEIANYWMKTLNAAAPTTVLLANGLPPTESFSVDALVGGPLGGVLGAPILLVQKSSLPAGVQAFLDANSKTITTVLALGGTAVIDQAVLDAADTAAQTTNNDNPQAFTVAGGPAQQSNAVGTNTRTCTATVTSGTVVDILLLPSANITTSSTGGTLFADTDSNNIADETAVAAVITTVNGADVPDAQKVTNTTSTGTVTFTISSTGTVDVTAVVFADPATGNNSLDLVAPTAANANPKAASEAVGTGCRTFYTPAEAGIGGAGGAVTAVNRDLDYFTTAVATYFYDSNDTFQFNGQPLTLAQFEGVLSIDDVVAASYAPEASGVSVFNITSDDPEAPGVPTATATNADAGTTANDVRVAVAPSAQASPGTVYTVQRASTAGLDATCGTVDDAAGTFTTVGTATLGTSSTTGLPEIQFTDLNVPNGCYAYRVVATNPATGATGNSPNSTAVTVPGAADTTAPTVTSARATDNGLVNIADSGDVHRFIFSEPMSTTADDNGANYAVIDTDGTTANIVCGTNATCSLNAAAVVINGTTYAANRVLTVTLGAVTGTGGTSTTLAYPLSVTGYSAQIKDVAGNQATTLGSDNTIQIATFTSDAP